MIDGIMFVTYDFDLQSLVNDEHLNFAPIIAPYTYGGMVTGYETKLNDVLRVKITIEYKHNGKYTKLARPKMEIQRSLHKYGHGRNDTDFTVKDVDLTINTLCELLRIDPCRCFVHTIEFGVNLSLNIKPSNVFSLYLMYSQKAFVSFRDIDANARFNGVRCSLSQFAIKVYDKGREYLRNDNLMRFECKVEKMQFLERQGVFIKTLEDLKNTENYVSLSNILNELHGKILKLNHCDLSIMTAKERGIFKDGQSIKFWNQIKKGTNDNTAQIRYKRQMERFKMVNDTYKTDDRHGETGALIEQKCNDLMQKNVPIFTNSPKTPKSENVPIFTVPIKVNMGTFTSTYFAPLPKYF